MKRILFLFGLLVCLAGMPLTAFADNKTAKQTYETAISDNWKTMLKNSIALDTINAENNTHLLNWQDVKNPSDEAVTPGEKIRKLQASVLKPVHHIVFPKRSVGKKHIFRPFFALSLISLSPCKCLLKHNI